MEAAGEQGDRRVMITADEIRKTARLKGFPAGVIEKDYALTCLLHGIYGSGLKDILVFKGGTALSKLYFVKLFRLSEDLDFTVIRAVSALEIEQLLDKCLKDISEKVMEFSLKSFHSNPEHIIAEIKFTGPLGKNRIRMDISLNEKIITDPVMREDKSGYYDIKKSMVLAYSLDEIFAEKLRSIIQRGKSRDYFDVWMLMKRKKTDCDKIRRLFREKCTSKNIVPRYDLFFEDTKLNEARDFWGTGLARLMNDVPDFDDVIRDLRRDLEFLRGIDG